MIDVVHLANPNEVKFLMDRDQVAKAAQQCNMKKRELSFVIVAKDLSDCGLESAKLAEEQSVHLFLCILINDLTEHDGPVVREARVTNVLETAFDVIIVSHL